MMTTPKYIHPSRMEITTILDNKLYLGDIHDASNDKLMKQLNIGCIINTTKECIYDYDPDIEMHKFDIIDKITDSIAHCLSKIVTIIKENIDKNKKVLVHCFLGRSRSASIVLAYLMRHHEMDLQTAYDYVLSKRQIKPNATFMEELYKYEVAIYGKTNFSLNNYKIQYLSHYLKVTPKLIGPIYRKNNGDLFKTIAEMNKVYKYTKRFHVK
jgi:hypothetical protein